jgi:hypothetical protein
MENFSSSHTQAHLSGPVVTEHKFYDTAASATHQAYGTVNVRSGQVGFTFFVLNSEQAQAIAAEFGALANDLAIEEVTQANLKAEQETAERAAAEAREQAERGATEQAEQAAADLTTW